MRWILSISAFIGLGTYPDQVRAQDPPLPIKTAFVKVAAVFSKYEKAIAFKEALEQDFKPFKQKADRWSQEITQYKEAIANDGKMADGGNRRVKGAHPPA